VRRAAIAAVGDRLRHVGTDERACDALLDALDDDDDDVRRIASFGLASSESDKAWTGLLEATQERGGTEPAVVTRTIVLAAAKAGDDDVLRRACGWPDARTRSIAFSALSSMARLEPAARERARTDEDPWIRRAVIEADHALDALSTDPDPSLRREAFACACRNGHALAAARMAASSSDPWLRVHAAERLARATDAEDVERAMTLLSDSDPAVRAAAADVWMHSPIAEARMQRRVDEALASGPPDVPSPVRTERHSARRADPCSAPTVASPRLLGGTGIEVSPLGISGAHEPSIASLFGALDAGCNLYFWEPRHRNLTTFLREAQGRRRSSRVIAGTYHATERAIRRDIERALRSLGRDAIDVFLVFWTRSDARLQGEVSTAIQRAKREGLILAGGFSTHDRALAERTIRSPDSPWDVIMIRHSAAHPGAEDSLFACAQQRDVGVIGFSATSYGRLLRAPRDRVPAAISSAADCYRYTLSQPGVNVCLSAPRGGRELVENLCVLRDPTLPAVRLEELRAIGRLVRKETTEFARTIRRFPSSPPGLIETSLPLVPVEAALDDLEQEQDGIAAEGDFS
jgi:hypothetical protein